jgi:hypothetical protein
MAADDDELDERVTPNGDLPQRVAYLEDEVTDLDDRVKSLLGRAAVPAEDVVYRPPLWSQESAYPAAADRRLVGATLWPGVLGYNDLKVQPRAEGANMSVDVLPGACVVKGTEQAEQGSYLCSLSQRVNVPVAAAPSAGNWRHTHIIARVYEPVDAEAYWRVEAVNTPAFPEGQPIQFATYPPSTLLLADIMVKSGTSQLTQAMINQGAFMDYRPLSRPAPIGATFARELWLPDTVPQAATWMIWGNLTMAPRLTSDMPLDFEVTVEGSASVRGPLDTHIRCQAMLEVTSRAGPTQTFISRQSLTGLTAARQGAPLFNAFSRKLTVSAFSLGWPYRIIASARVHVDSPQEALLQDGVLTLRVTPSAAGHIWGTQW